jgi:serine/threonine-protein kinase RsbW
MMAIALPVGMESIEEVTRLVEKLSTDAALSAEGAYRLRLAAEEIVTNVVQHADFAGTGRRPSFQVDGGVDADRVWVRLTDSAAAFDPTEVPEPADLTQPLENRSMGGLGIYLTRKALDEFTYERVDGHNSTTIALRRGG